MGEADAGPFCIHCRHAFDGMHCRANAPVVLTRGNPDYGTSPPRVTWTGFPLLPNDKRGCGQFDDRRLP